MSPARHRTPHEPDAVDDDLEGPSSQVRPTLTLQAVPWLAVSVGALRSLPLDSRAAYVLSLVDGQCTVDLILDICDMERGEVLQILARLLELGAIALRER